MCWSGTQGEKEAVCNLFFIALQTSPLRTVLCTPLASFSVEARLWSLAACVMSPFRSRSIPTIVFDCGGPVIAFNSHAVDDTGLYNTQNPNYDCIYIKNTCTNRCYVLNFT